MLLRRILGAVLAFLLALEPTLAWAGGTHAPEPGNKSNNAPLPRAPAPKTGSGLSPGSNPVLLPTPFATSAHVIHTSGPGNIIPIPAAAPATPISEAQEPLKPQIVLDDHSPSLTGAAQPQSGPAFLKDPHPAPALSPHSEDPLGKDDALTRKIVEDAQARGFVFQPPRGLDIPGEGAQAPKGGHNLAPAGPTSSTKPSVPSPKPEAGKAASSHSGQALFYSLFVSQIPVEIMGLIVPQLADQLAGGRFSSSLLGTVSFLALGTGSLLGGPVIDRWGIRKVYLALFALRLAASVVLAATNPTFVVGLAGLIGLFGLDYLFLGSSRVAEALTSTAVHGSAQGKVNEFKTWQQMVIEGVGILGLALGFVTLTAKGFAGALWISPPLILVSGAITLFRLRLPDHVPASGNLRIRIREVRKALKENSLLRAAVIGYSMNVILGILVYFIIGPKLGLFAKPSGWSSSLATFLAELSFAVGGFLSMVFMKVRQLRAERTAKDPGAAPDAASGRAAHLRASIRWLKAGALALLGGWAFLAPGIWPAWPFMLLFGFTTTGIFVNLETAINTESPEGVRGSFLGIIRAGAFYAAALIAPLLGLAFSLFSVPFREANVPTAAAFGVLALILTGFAGVYLWVLRRLRRAIK